MAEKGHRGFALMNPDRQREIARLGGKAAHAKGSAHEFTAEEARDAGRRGGLSVSQRREHMAEIGRHGGRARRRKSTRQPSDISGQDASPVVGSNPDSDATLSSGQPGENLPNYRTSNTPAEPDQLDSFGGGEEDSGDVS